MSYENVVLNQDNNFYLMSLIILITYICWNVCGYNLLWGEVTS